MASPGNLMSAADLLQSAPAAGHGGDVPTARSARSMEFGIRFNTRVPLDQVEEWLSVNCPEGWDVRLAGIAEDPGGRLWKRLEIRFARADDRARFRDHFSRA